LNRVREVRQGPGPAPLSLDLAFTRFTFTFPGSLLGVCITERYSFGIRPEQSTTIDPLTVQSERGPN
jgi:hypothetical protein